jgi:hypothetical protein
MHENEDWVVSVAFSSKGDRIISCSSGTVQVWDARSGAELAVLRIGENCSRLAFSPAMDRIVSDLNGSITKVWDARSRDCLEVIQGCGDLWAIAVGESKFPLRALARVQETIVEQAKPARPVAWFAIPLHAITTHLSGRTWAGASGNHLYIIALEGAEMLSPAKERLESSPALAISEKMPWWRFWR